MGSLSEVAARYFAAVNAEDWDGLTTVFAPDAVFRPPGAPPAVGREAVIAHLRTVLTPLPEHEDRVTRMIETAGTVVCELAVSGRRPDGREIAFEALDVIDGDDRGITRVTTWYDTAGVARLLAG